MADPASITTTFAIFALSLQMAVFALFCKISKLSGMLRGSWLLAIDIFFMNISRTWTLTHLYKHKHIRPNQRTQLNPKF